MEGEADPRRRRAGGNQRRQRGRGRRGDGAGGAAAAAAAAAAGGEVEKVPVDTDVYIKGFGEEFDMDAFKDKLKTFGETKRFNRRRRSLVVIYLEAASADKCIAGINGKEFNGVELVAEKRMRAVRPPVQEGAPAADEERPLKPANPRNVYFGKLPVDVTEDTIRGMAEKFGAVKKVRVRRRFAVVTYENPEDAAKALALNGQKLEDEEIVVESEKPRPRRIRRRNKNNNEGGDGNGEGAAAGGRRRRKRKPNPRQVYFGGLTEEVTDDQLKEKLKGIKKIRRRRGFGMVVFESVEEAQAAIAMNDAKPFGDSLSIEPLKAREEEENAGEADE